MPGVYDDTAEQKEEETFKIGKRPEEILSQRESRNGQSARERCSRPLAVGETPSKPQQETTTPVRRVDGTGGERAGRPVLPWPCCRGERDGHVAGGQHQGPPSPSRAFVPWEGNWAPMNPCETVSVASFIITRSGSYQGGWISRMRLVRRDTAGTGGPLMREHTGGPRSTVWSDGGQRQGDTWSDCIHVTFWRGQRSGVRDSSGRDGAGKGVHAPGCGRGHAEPPVLQSGTAHPERPVYRTTMQKTKLTCDVGK